ncbi:unnamed protein product [Cuscuta campestris]|uniref:FAF domain-containing protein n=1 Tax=Cuscuta campestris TaxID=132261 RepID=A0A484KLD1_9ASTE|nr:unnamed protein product [Cuscuta campestris]
MPPIVYHTTTNNDNQLHSCNAAASGRLRAAQSPLPPGRNSDEHGGDSPISLQSQLSPFDAAVEIHPPPRKPSLRKMTEQSLAMCTEILGSETGADIFESDELYSLVVSTDRTAPGPHKQADESFNSSGSRGNNNSSKKKCYSSRGDRNNFPPPLTTMRGPACRRLTCRREGGRLVVAAADVLSRQSFRQVEASSGRLKIFFYTNEGNTSNCSGDNNKYDGGDRDSEAAAAGTVGEEIMTEEEDGESEAEESGILGVDQVEMGMKKCVAAAAAAAGRSCKEGGQGISEIFGIPVHNSKLCLYS